MKRQHYDFAFGLGIVCSCSETLRAAGLQYLSFPYDWITIDPKGPYPISCDLERRTAEIVDEFSTWFRKDDFKYQRPLQENGKDQYSNTRLDLIFNHDFVTGVPYDEMYEQVNAKYQRRCKRMIEGIRAANRILVLRVDRPDKPGELTDPEECRKVQRALQEKFAPRRFDVVHFTYEKGRAYKDRKVEQMGEGYTRITFDYRDYTPGKMPYQVDLPVTGRCLAQLCAVKDYRTAEEKRKYHEQRWAKRLKKAGVETRLQYHLGQISAFLHGRCNVLCDLVARLKRKRFEQIVILGFNCEAAFRFVCTWDFLDSSLFAWTNSRNLDNLTAAIGKLSAICAGEMEFHAPSRMWQCLASRVYFHGRMRPVPGAPAPTEDEKAADLAELRSRLAHLKEKFVRYATNEKSTLFVYKMRTEDAKAPDLAAKLDALEAALVAAGARNWTLLVICERSVLAKVPTGPNRVIRAVTKFNPGEDVTSRKKGDPAGWNRIFSEFAPAVVLKRTHKFKYE